MAITRYTQNVAIMQCPFSTGPIGDYVGGGPIAGPQVGAFPIQYNYRALSWGRWRKSPPSTSSTATSRSTTSSTSTAQPGSMLDPGAVLTNAAFSSTLTLEVGDDDADGLRPRLAWCGLHPHAAHRFDHPAGRKPDASTRPRLRWDREPQSGRLHRRIGLHGPVCRRHARGRACRWQPRHGGLRFVDSGPI